MAVEHSSNPADGFPRITPSLRYEDVGAALGRPSDACGLREHLRCADGIVRHASLKADPPA